MGAPRRKQPHFSRRIRDEVALSGGTTNVLGFRGEVSAAMNAPVECFPEIFFLSNAFRHERFGAVPLQQGVWSTPPQEATVTSAKLDLPKVVRSRPNFAP